MPDRPQRGDRNAELIRKYLAFEDQIRNDDPWDAIERQRQQRLLKSREGLSTKVKPK